ncbi:MAG: hypothetical protein QXL32_04750 [Candidatus Bathyarchaeia archaeon]
MSRIAEKVPGWVARVLLPEIRSIIKEEVASEVKGLNEKIDLLRNELLSEIRRVDERLGAEIKRVDERLGSEIGRVEAEVKGMDGKLSAKLEGLEKALPLASRLAVLEAEVKELREKVSGAGP